MGRNSTAQAEGLGGRSIEDESPEGAQPAVWRCDCGSALSGLRGIMVSVPRASPADAGSALGYRVSPLWGSCEIWVSCQTVRAPVLPPESSQRCIMAIQVLIAVVPPPAEPMDRG